MAAKRIYVVTTSAVGNVPAMKKLVRAANQARAERHVVDELLKVKAAVAAQEELIGVKAEDVVDAKEE